MAKQTKKKNKIKQRRRRVALAVLILFFIMIIYFLFRAKNYEKEYQKDDYKIKEKFDKQLKSYTFEITKENITWHFITDHKYIHKKKLIEKIEYFENDKTKCIIPISAKLKTYPQCIQNDELIDYHLVEEELIRQLGSQYFNEINQEKENYEKITLRNLDQNTYYIWNYKGFYKINQKTKENIPIFSKDIYDITNVTKVKEYIVIPDYNEAYYFNKFYLINTKKGNLSTWEFDESIYFDGYYLGSEKNSLFYVDKKMKIEWELLPKRKKMRKVGTEKNMGKILKNDGWEKISLTKLTTDIHHFEKEETYHYEIDNGLYVTYIDCEARKKISNKKVKEIVATIGSKVYYLVGDSLYYYTEETGEVELMTYFEWNFNYQNMIFIEEN